MPIVAEHAPELHARITRRVAMRYDAGARADLDRPPHVRAASGLTWFKEYLAIVQDDANWLALIDARDRVHAIPLPPDTDTGARVFDVGRGNKHRKIDLEACITVPGDDGDPTTNELIGFGSGSHVGREWLLRVHEGRPLGDHRERHRDPEAGLDIEAEFVNVRRFYDSLRATTDFAGAGLNIEGAVALADGDTILLFNRGNAPTDGTTPAVDATARISWRALRRHLEDPEGVAPPALGAIQPYDLGTLDGVRLTFSDAEDMGGPILYSASAENPETDAIAGSVLGVLHADGRARWATVRDEAGELFRGKIEGLSHQPGQSRKIHFVIDDDDETIPSEIFEAELSGPWPFAT
jgi:hypothetical protein